MENALALAIKESNNSLPERKLKELIERSNLSADMKALLSDVARVTIKIGGKIISIGRKVLSIVFDLIKAFPTVTLGVIAALVITSLIGAIPIVGALFASLLSSILLLLGVAAGALHDFSSPALGDRISKIMVSMSALKEA
jgi:hypothetical protein